MELLADDLIIVGRRFRSKISRVPCQKIQNLDKEMEQKSRSSREKKKLFCRKNNLDFFRAESFGNTNFNCSMWKGKKKRKIAKCFT